MGVEALNATVELNRRAPLVRGMLSEPAKEGRSVALGAGRGKRHQVVYVEEAPPGEVLTDPETRNSLRGPDGAEIEEAISRRFLAPNSREE
jgi:hypothetical protein